MTNIEKLESFTKKQAEMLDMQIGTKAQVDKLLEEFKVKGEELKKEYQDKVDAIEEPTKAALEKYRCELREWVGFADGDATNVIQLVSAILKIKTSD